MRLPYCGETESIVYSSSTSTEPSLDTTDSAGTHYVYSIQRKFRLSISV